MRLTPPLSIACLLVMGASAVAQPLELPAPETPFEKSDGWSTAEYQEGIDFYRTLAGESRLIQFTEQGRTDSGLPLHLVLISANGDFDIARARREGRAVLMINNAIHPGESDGVDASMAFVRDLVREPDKYREALAEVLVGVIPFYNIGGVLNRNSHTRANQNGPRAYGFRGNARNYDLNRDFVKCDTLNARAFAKIFHLLDPDLLVDTHVSNGADYQHVMTTAHSQKDKLGLSLGKFFENTFRPQLFGRMAELGYPTVPYVNSEDNPPEEGFPQFLETPRYSTGYAALFQTMGFMTETHMLKPYPQRVAATRAFLDQSLFLLAEHRSEIRDIRAADRAAYPRQVAADIAWQVDSDRPSRLEFRGFRARRVESQVTVGKRLLYDRSQPFVQNINFFDNYVASKQVAIPAAYLVPRGWHSVIELLELNQVEFERIKDEATYDGEFYRIEERSTRDEPYEGHFFHDRVVLSSQRQQLVARPGDVLVRTNQRRARYVVETLEPEAMDSFFRWNFFDSVLQQKESFSPYVFEDTARKLLADDPQLAVRFKAKLTADPEFASDRLAQLTFLFRASPHYEPAHRRYPIVRVLTLPESQPTRALR